MFSDIGMDWVYYKERDDVMCDVVDGKGRAQGTLATTAACDEGGTRILMRAGDNALESRDGQQVG